MRVIAAFLIIVFVYSCKNDGHEMKTIEEINGRDLCDILDELVKVANNDSILMNHFSLQNPVKYSIDTVLGQGLPRSFAFDYSKIHKSKEFDDNGNETLILDWEQVAREEKYIIKCIKNNHLIEEADVYIKFWYLKEDNLFALDATKLSKSKNAYYTGYSYLFKIGENGDLIFESSSAEIE